MRSFKGTPNTLKNKLDSFLELIPDQPEVDSIKSGARTLYGDSSNHIVDWVRCLHLIDLEFNDELTDEGRTMNSNDGRKTISAMNSEDRCLCKGVRTQS